jgi:hypothetical protein
MINYGCVGDGNCNSHNIGGNDKYHAGVGDVMEIMVVMLTMLVAFGHVDFK